MTSTRWALWLGTFGAGACIALGAGHGVAAADTDSSDSGGSPSGSTGQESSQTSRDSSDKRDDTKGDTDADTEDGTEDAEDTSADPASVPSSAKRSDEAKEEAESDRTITLDREAAESEEAEEDTAAEEADTAASDPDATTTVKRSAASEPAVESAIPSAHESSVDTTAPVVAEPVVAPASTTTQTSTTADASPSSDPVTTAAPDSTTAEAGPLAASAGTVTGVQTGRAKLTIPVGTNGYTTRADWYLPTQADGSVSATGVMWLQHGFLGNKLFVSALAQRLSQQTNSIVVAPNISSFPLSCSACWLNGVPMQQAVASMFLADRASLNASALAAGFQGTLPENFILSGQSAGGGFAAAAGGYYATDPGNDDSLRGVVMFDGFAWNGVVTDALERLDTLDIPVYQVAAPPQPWNSNGATTAELVAARPGQFVGAILAGGSHYDSLIGANPLIDFFGQLVTGFSPPGNTEAVYTLATGWINDMYLGLGPSDGTGIYGAPDEYIVMGDTAAIVLGPPPVVDIDRYLGTWYEVGSVKQFFSIGLVNTTAVYSPNPDGSIKVENSGNYFFNNGPQSTITGVALPVDSTNNKLSVRFFGSASANPPGNYWIVDLDPDYQWAVVSDPTGFSGFLLSRTRTVSDALYQELLDRASVKGVKGRITPTRQPAAAEATTAV
ncbi:Outer membrane lipoprotein Blc [Mycolicibacterium vanbaalenii]|uniref:Outer membrane lipoprotein Blc n=1 Tax=Mycolicibacterium vanbaalenii TaxID=110539 RepID=A0A5S9R9F2_MYCVN|nr:lipocalin family protein [Mycolicibacterium vanbaalenii]CAA0134485.1 Outer membrane lipoprotein Blc [Mycolicibacterium vanbaalenii]